jgi:hypothetical protein
MTGSCNNSWVIGQINSRGGAMEERYASWSCSVWKGGQKEEDGDGNGDNKEEL